MTAAFAIAAVIFLLVIAAGMHLLSPIFMEFNYFLRLVGLLLVLIIGAGVYLSFTVPNIARANPFAKKTQATVLQDEPIGMQLNP